MEQSILLLLAGVCLYFAARFTGRIWLLLFWILSILSGILLGYFTNDKFLLVGSLICVAFLIEDWRNFNRGS